MLFIAWSWNSITGLLGNMRPRENYLVVSFSGGIFTTLLNGKVRYNNIVMFEGNVVL